MTEESKMAMRATKCANIIMCLCELYGLSFQEATDIFYQSETEGLIEDGVADLQCRSNKYLASLVWEEYQEAAGDKKQIMTNSSQSSSISGSDPVTCY